MSYRSRLVGSIFLVGVGLSVGAATLELNAYAQAKGEPSASDKDSARKLLESGDTAMAKKEYEVALKAYLGAQSYVDAPTTGLAVAQAQAALKHYIEARDAALSVTRLPKWVNESDELLRARVDAEKLANDLDGTIPSIEIQPKGLPADAALDLVIDGATIPPAAATLPRRVNPGTHKITLKSPGYVTAVVEIETQEGPQTVSVPIEMKSDVAKPDPIKPDTEGRKISLLLPIGGAITGAGLIVGIATGVAALNSCTSKGCALGWVADIGFIVAAGGAAVGVAGLVLTFTSSDPPKDPAKEPPKAVTFTPLIGPGYAGVLGRF